MKRHRFPTSSTTKVSTVLAAVRGFVFAATCLPALAGCATAPLPPAAARHHQAAKELREARSKHASTEQRLGHYLQAAEAAGPLLEQGVEAPAVRDIYNATVAEFTVLLRSADGGRLWNRPLAVTIGSTSYRLRYAPTSRKEGTWAPECFSAFETPKQVHEDRIRLRLRDAGFGGTLVGINRPADPKKFYFPSVGVAGAVTAVLDFKPAAPGSKAPREVVLSLHEPTCAKPSGSRTPPVRWPRILPRRSAANPSRWPSIRYVCASVTNLLSLWQIRVIG